MSENIKHAVGRPRVFDYDDIVVQFNKYIDVTEYPIVKEFCEKYGINYQHLEDIKLKGHAGIAECIKRSIQKSETYLEKNALHNKINSTFAIFRLKQPCFGWTDKQEIVSTNTNTTVNLTDDEINKKLDEMVRKVNNK